jgi:hypothetical protein
MDKLGGGSTLRRFLKSTGLRWLPLSLLMPVLVWLALDRGLLTGGLADIIGHRCMLLASSVAGV